MGKVDKVVHTLSTYPTIEKSCKLKLYTLYYIKKTKYNNIYINNQNIQKDILLKTTTTMKKGIHLTETGNFHIGETDVDEKCTK